MSVVGIGIDLVEVARISRLLERHGERAVHRICNEGEADLGRAVLDQHLAGLFAAKEAVLKALGTGWAQGTAFRQVEVVRGAGGAPSVRLHDVAAARAAALGVTRIHLSITHDGGHAAAVAVLESGGGDER
ncbi:MAG TPA: holo-ACP synthase [Thermoanaerobaculia bacterium]|jgi:holo-[acyl-carrier protein] synthase|nr:holo-ACP synthase [Thermoanaerobaculia bacterium]